jgi:prolyl oligopeptidase
MAGDVTTEDPFLWLEGVNDDRALEWARLHSQATMSELGGDRFDQMRAEVLKVADSADRIPSVARRGPYLYNFWRDANHPRGLWRRTTLEEYRKESPEWDVLVDVDALAADEGENWVWASVEALEPEYTRALIRLSPGGADVTVVREFDLAAKQFVVGGFELPAARSDVQWEDEDTLLVATDFGPGSLSAAGFPLVVKRWRRGTPLEAAETVFTGEKGDFGAFVGVDRIPGYHRTMFMRQIDNNNREKLLWRDGELIRLDLPTDAPMAINREWLLICVVTEWAFGGRTYEPGTVLVTNFDDMSNGNAKWQVVFKPDGHTHFQGAIWTKNRLVIATTQDVCSRIGVMEPGEWEMHPIAGLPDNAETGVAAADRFSDEIFVVSTTFDQPPRLLHGHAGGPVRVIKTSPHRFDPESVTVTQHFVNSIDGTRVPYFLVTPRSSRGPMPTLLHGYGGFGIPQLPGYLGVTGRLWLERGGAYVVANTRGGGEYGPQWYLQTVRAGRHKVAEDFAAVAGDLIARGVTTAGQLGAAGGSAGGLLMGVMLTQYPDLFGALVCNQPLLDMRRYTALGGAATIAEYGDPDDPVEWEFIREYSPYHNIEADRVYPPIFLTTSTTDDRVQPGHARKMAAALSEAGHRVLFYENTHGGHSGASNNQEAATVTAMTYEFLLRELFD